MPRMKRGMTQGLQSTQITDPQSHDAVDGVADRLRAGGAVEEKVGDPAVGDPEAEPAAIFEPALVSDCRHHEAIAGDGGDDAGMRGKGSHDPAIDVGFDAGAEQMRPLPADLDQAVSIVTAGDRGIERVE